MSGHIILSENPLPYPLDTQYFGRAGEELDEEFRGEDYAIAVLESVEDKTEASVR
jgi:hypothetical protein